MVLFETYSYVFYSDFNNQNCNNKRKLRVTPAVQQNTTVKKSMSVTSSSMEKKTEKEVFSIS